MNGALTRAVFGQVLVFALLFLPKRAAGLAAPSGLAFTGRPPVFAQTVLGLKEIILGFLKCASC